MNNLDMQISLNEYSNKYRVSVSTLRRRIKKQDIQFSFDQGKYFILDKPLHEHTLPPRKVAQKDLAPPHNLNLKANGFKNNKENSKENINQKLEPRDISKSEFYGESPSFDQDIKKNNQKTQSHLESSSEMSFAETANNLLSELKKAYMQILSEKEEQIIYLKEEIADLKTLVRVLESENHTLKKELDYTQHD